MSRDILKARAYHRKYYRLHQEETLTRQKKYYKFHRAECLKRSKEWGTTHRERRKQYSDEYYKLHREKILEHSKIYCAVHKDKIKERSKKYRKLHREELRVWHRKYRELHRDELALQRKNNAPLLRAHKAKLRIDALIKLSQTTYPVCEKCGCTDTRLLQINHLVRTWKGSRPHTEWSVPLYRKILKMKTPHKHYNVLCGPCNTRYFWEQKFRTTFWEIKYIGKPPPEAV